jgi:spermidine synthase
MDLDDTVQVGAAYRPHYHEYYAVHQTTRSLPDNSINRVFFVGGGDSMLLHEVLKYPSLELVVSLELDQNVTRGCFKHC